MHALQMRTSEFEPEPYVNCVLQPSRLLPGRWMRPIKNKTRKIRRLDHVARSIPTFSGRLAHSFAFQLCFGEGYLGPALLGEVGFGTGRPIEGFRVLVSMRDPIGDRRLEFGDSCV